MCLFKLTQSQYAQKRVVKTIGDQILFFNERRSTHISQELSYYAVTLGIGYEVHWYIATGLLPLEEFSEERLWTDVAEWWALSRGTR